MNKVKNNINLTYLKTGVDYSTIERDYGSSAGNTLTSSRDHNQLTERDGEMHSLSANKSRANEINTRGISGPGTYRPNEYSGGGSSRQVLDLPNIDIGGGSGIYQDSKKTSSNRSQGGGPRVQFPDRPNIVDNRQRYVSSSEFKFFIYYISQSLYFFSQ